MFNRSFLRRRKISQLPQSILQYDVGETNQQFGYSVDMSEDGTTAIVGMPYSDPAPLVNSGRVLIFTRSGTTWTQEALLSYSAAATSDEFGTSVALSSDGNTALIGKPTGLGAGGAVVFTRSGGTWTEQAAFTYSGAVAIDRFGTAVALSSDGNTAILGAQNDDTVAGANAGSAVVFTRSGVTWTQEAFLTDSSGAANDLFGYSVALSSDGNTAVIGAPAYNSSEGCIVVFTRSGITWTQQSRLRDSSPSYQTRIGTSVDISSDGNTLISGGNQYLNATGLAIIWTYSGSSWTQQQKITRSNGAIYDYFGSSVNLSASGNIAIVGVPESNAVASNSGSAVVFILSAGVWVEASTLTDISGGVNNYFGTSVALSKNGNIAICGSKSANAGRGRALVSYNH